MKTALSQNNPFGRNRYGFLFETLRKQKPQRHLDYGAYDGKIIRALLEAEVVSEAVGVDVNAGVVSKNERALPANGSLVAIKKLEPLPFESNSFDSASILDVIEHVIDQKFILDECVRVLKPNGILVVTVPGKHFFSFLDIGNFKFIFPAIHKWYYSRKHSPSEYHRRYVLCENGLIGDIEKGKDWHEHFSRAKLKGLLEQSGLREIRFDGCGFFDRLLSLFAMLLPKGLRGPIDKLLRLDEKHFEQTHLFSVGTKLS